MSLVVARIDGNKIGIVSDTKLTYPNHETKRLKTSPIDGTIKAIILNNNICIGFAGEIEEAALALKEIKDTSDIKVILQILEKHHKLSFEKTDFIICIGNPKLTIFEIKNGIIAETQNAWIGDPKAFEIFQEDMLSPKKNEETKQTNPSIKPYPNAGQPSATILDMNLTFEVNHNSILLSKLSSAMDKVIEDENIDSVGGFKINIIYDGHFSYNEYIKNYRSNIELFGYGSQVISHGTASDGSYSINFIGGSSDYKSVALHVSQGEFGIVYNRIDFGLLTPLVYNFDEVDFIDHTHTAYNIEAKIVTQDKVHKYMNAAAHYFNKKNYIKSEELFDKAFRVANNVEKAKVLFNKGLVLFQLKDKRPAIAAFNQAIKIDPSYTNRIITVLNPKR